jgi:hypothetical protein
VGGPEVGRATPEARCAMRGKSNPAATPSPGICWFEISLTEYLQIAKRNAHAERRKFTSERIEAAIASFVFVKGTPCIFRRDNIFREMIVTFEERDYVNRRRLHCAAARRRKSCGQTSTVKTS